MWARFSVLWPQMRLLQQLVMNFHGMWQKNPELLAEHCQFVHHRFQAKHPGTGLET
jgi:hypothetical protein